jgi:hypothetical protein
MMEIPIFKNLLKSTRTLEDVITIIDQLDTNDQSIASSLQRLRARAMFADDKAAAGTITNDQERAEFLIIMEGIEKILKRISSTSTNRVAESNKIYFCSASPINRESLQVSREFDKISRQLDSSPFKTRFEILPRLSVDLFTAIRDLVIINPLIVHFSGHGEIDGLVFADSNNEAELVPTSVLDDTLKHANIQLSCIFLSACYSSSQASILSKYSMFTIGMKEAVPDEISISFVEAFYGILFSIGTLDILRAYNLAKAFLPMKKMSIQAELWQNGKIQ